VTPGRRLGRVLSAVLVAALAACATGGAENRSAGTSQRTLLVFAAASLTESFTRLGQAFGTAHPGVDVRFSFAGSSTLAQQIKQGAPADVFAAASPATMAQVTDADLTQGEPAVFARNRLTIAVPPDNPARIAGLADLAAEDRKVVLCAPRVPCGAAAQRALRAAGVAVRPVSLEQDVKAALTKVTLGEADAALVYRTDVKAAAGKVRGIDFPESAQAVNDYPIAALRAAPQPELAGQFVELVLSGEGRSVLTEAGFEVP
jgi:molybdate transport system substrate-binding protein